MKKIILCSILAMFITSVCSYSQHASQSGTQAIVIKSVLPKFPVLPSGGLEGGEVTVNVIFASGKVSRIEASGGTPILQREAKEAASHWLFSGDSHDLSILFAFRLLDKGAAVCRSSIAFEIPIRVEVCAAERQIVTISDPPVADLDKQHKK